MAGIMPGEWAIFAHPLFLDQVERLIQAVEKERAQGKRGTANQKVLAAILRYVPSIP